MISDLRFPNILILPVLCLLSLGCELEDEEVKLSDDQQADIQAAVNELESNPDPTTSDTSGTSSAPSNESELFFSNVNWLRSDPAAPNARVTKNLGSLSVSSRGVSYVATDVGDWPAQGDTHGVMCLAVIRNGVWSGGKFDHVRRNTRFRDFNNVGGYLPVQPRSGEAVRFWIVNYAGTEATNFVQTTWP